MRGLFLFSLVWILFSPTSGFAQQFQAMAHEVIPVNRDEETSLTFDFNRNFSFQYHHLKTSSNSNQSCIHALSILEQPHTSSFCYQRTQNPNFVVRSLNDTEIERSHFKFAALYDSNNKIFCGHSMALQLLAGSSQSLSCFESSRSLETARRIRTAEITTQEIELHDGGYSLSIKAYTDLQSFMCISAVVAALNSTELLFRSKGKQEALQCYPYYFHNRQQENPQLQTTFNFITRSLPQVELNVFEKHRAFQVTDTDDEVTCDIHIAIHDNDDDPARSISMTCRQEVPARVEDEQAGR